MDKLAAKLDMDPVEFRQLDVMEQGTLLPTGQPCDSPAPVAELLRRVRSRPLPPEQQWPAAGGEGASVDVRALPGGLSNTTQGLGVAVMEEIIVDPKTAKVRDPSFTEYLIPTILDTPAIPVDVLELADEHAPYGLRGVGEAPPCRPPRPSSRRSGTRRGWSSTGHRSDPNT